MKNNKKALPINVEPFDDANKSEAKSVVHFIFQNCWRFVIIKTCSIRTAVYEPYIVFLYIQSKLVFRRNYIEKVLEIVEN